MIARGSHSFTCHPLTNHTCLYSPAAGHHRPLAGILITPTHGRMTKLSWPEWLVIYWERFSSTGDWTPDTVTHLSTNRVRRRLTSLIETNALTTTPNSQPYVVDAERSEQNAVILIVITVVHVHCTCEWVISLTNLALTPIYKFVMELISLKIVLCYLIILKIYDKVKYILELSTVGLGLLSLFFAPACYSGVKPQYIHVCPSLLQFFSRSSETRVNLRVL